jgi:hypothetical protein
MAVATSVVWVVRTRAQPSQKVDTAQKTTRTINAAFDQAVKLGDEARQADQLPKLLIIIAPL